MNIVFYANQKINKVPVEQAILSSTPGRISYCFSGNDTKFWIEVNPILLHIVLEVSMPPSLVMYITSKYGGLPSVCLLKEYRQVIYRLSSLDHCREVVDTIVWSSTFIGNRIAIEIPYISANTGLLGVEGTEEEILSICEAGLSLTDETWEPSVHVQGA